MVYETIVIEKQDPIAILKFSRPYVLNSLNRRFFRDDFDIC